MLTEVVLIFDHARQTLSICANINISGNLGGIYNNAVRKIEETLGLLAKPLSIQPASLNLSDHGNKKLPQGNFTQEKFESLVEKTKNYIRKGDIIQAVLSQRFSIPYSGTTNRLISCDTGN